MCFANTYIRRSVCNGVFTLMYLQDSAVVASEDEEKESPVTHEQVSL